MNQLLKHHIARGNENSKVVALAKNSDRIKPQQPRAHFAQQTPRSKRFEIQIRLQVYQRARYYDCQTGEFASQDSLEYVDGMSLYRAYFVPGGMDPFGLSCCSSDGCQWERHHWFPREHEAGIQTKCPGFNIHFFATPLLRCWGKYKNHDAHGWLHDDRIPKWNDLVKARLASAKNCCDFIISMDLEITKAYGEIIGKFNEPAKDGTLPYDPNIWTRTLDPVPVEHGPELLHLVSDTTKLFSEMAARCKKNRRYVPDHENHRFRLPGGGLQPTVGPEVIIGGIGSGVRGIGRVILRLIGRGQGSSGGGAPSTVPFQRRDCVPFPLRRAG